MDTPLPSIEKMIAAARENPERLGELLDRYRPFLTLRARYGLPDGLAHCVGASDLVQETMLDAVRGFAKFGGHTEPEFSQWIKQIQARNLVDLMRKHKLQTSHQLPLYDPEATASFWWQEPAANQSSPSERVIRGENALRLAETVQALPPAQAEAICLRHLKGWKIEQIAEHMGRTTVAVSGLLRHGLAKLRSRMSQESWL